MAASTISDWLNPIDRPVWMTERRMMISSTPCPSSRICKPAVTGAGTDVTSLNPPASALAMARGAAMIAPDAVRISDRMRMLSYSAPCSMAVLRPR